VSATSVPAQVSATSVPAQVSATSVPVEPATTPGGDVNTLLVAAEVSILAGVDELTTDYRDAKAMAASVDPSQVEHMDSFDMLSIETTDRSRGLTLTTIDFDSEAAAADHMDLMVEDTGLLDLPDKIGDVSGYVEANDGGIGSVVVFKKGDWVVQLHTAQGAGVSPLVNLEQLTELARLVADRL
jgi:hypothetical protein